jgi:hypothetical protein
MLNLSESVLAEIRHIRKNLIVVPGSTGTFFRSTLSKLVAGMEGGKVQKVMDLRLHEDGLYTSFYALIGEDRAAVYVSRKSAEPPAESGAVWLALESLYLEGEWETPLRQPVTIDPTPFQAPPQDERGG